jgi:hypothetical protein
MGSKKSLNLTIVFCLCFSSALMADDSKSATTSNAATNSKTAAASLSAGQILEKHIAARGGLQAWHSVQAMSWTGKLDAGSGDSVSRSARFAQAALSPSMRKAPSAKALSALDADALKGEADKQVQLPFVLEMKHPHMSRLEIEFAGKTAVQVYDGTHGWKVRPFLNRNDVEPFTEDEAKSEASKSDIEGPLVGAAAEGTKVALEAVESVEGRDAYRLKLTMKSGNVQHIWIDAQSFLDVKIEGTPRRMDGRMRTVWIYQRDFRPVQGVIVPFVLETAVEGYPNTHKMLIDKVAVNPKLDGGLFTKPKV